MHAPGILRTIPFWPQSQLGVFDPSSKVYPLTQDDNSPGGTVAPLSQEGCGASFHPISPYTHVTIHSGPGEAAVLRGKELIGYRVSLPLAHIYSWSPT